MRVDFYSLNLEGPEILIIIVIIFFFTHLFIHQQYKKQINKKATYINKLLESQTELQEKLNDEQRRKAFRVKLLEQKCVFEFIDFGDKLLDKLKHKKGEGLIKDISLTGTKLICKFDLPIRKKITIHLYFTLKGEDFSFKGNLVRKEERLKEITYGIEFIEIDEKEQQKLFRVLQEFEIQRKKKME